MAGAKKCFLYKGHHWKDEDTVCMCDIFAVALGLVLVQELIHENGKEWENYPDGDWNLSGKSTDLEDEKIFSHTRFSVRSMCH